MAQTLEQINAVRKRLGQEELTELPGAKPDETPESAAKAEEPKPDESAPPVAKAEPKKEAEPELNDEAVLKYLQGKGLSVNSFDDLNKPVTEADLQRQAEQRENEKLSYGLNKGMFNRKTHEQFILDRNNKKDLVFTEYYHSAKKEDPSLSDEDIQAEFASKFGLDAEPNTRKHKRGEQEIEILGDIILKNKYPNIFKLDSEYDFFENATKQQREFEQKVAKGAPLFKKDVEDVFSELKKVTTKFSDDESYEVEVLDDALNSLKEKFFDKNFVAQKISQGYTKEELKDIAFTALLKENWPIIAKEMINQALLKNQKGVKGIVPVGPQAKQSDDSQLSDSQKKALARIFPDRAPVAN